MGKIKEPIKREKKLSTNELIAFFEALPPFYRDVAMFQFYTAARIQEVAGLQVSSVDISKRSLLIKDVVVWNRSKKFVELKAHTKNGETRFCHLTDLLVDIFNRRLSETTVKCSYVFHENGYPLSYRKIQHAYNFALKQCGLGARFSGSHILRHSMATITRLVTGSLDATQAITGHKDQKLVQHYASMPDQAQKDAVKSVDEHFKSQVRASKCEQSA